MSTEQRVKGLEVDVAESEGRVLKAIADLKSDMRSEIGGLRSEMRAGFRVTIKALITTTLDPHGPPTDQVKAEAREELLAYLEDIEGGGNGTRT